MIKYFLDDQADLTPKIKHIIHNDLTKTRQYQPFHIDCSVTKKKICYCINNPVINIQMPQHVKQKIWKNYQEVQRFYVGPNENDLKKATQNLEKIKTKIQCLSKKQVVSFVKSIEKQKNLMGEIIEY